MQCAVRAVVCSRMTKKATAVEQKKENKGKVELNPVPGLLLQLRFMLDCNPHSSALASEEAAGCGTCISTAL